MPYWAAYILFLADDVPEKLMFCDLGAIIVDTFQCTDVQGLRCYTQLLCTVILHLSIQQMNTTHYVLFFDT
jgi:hypothetical protein